MSRWVLVALATLGVAGCSFDRPFGYRAVNSCDVDEECVTGLCYEGVCASPPDDTLRVAIQIITGPSDIERAPASSVLPVIEVSDNGRKDLTVSALARVAGKVRFRGEPVPALLSFTRPPSVPGGPATRVEIDTGDPYGDGSVDYVASLPAGEELDLEIRISGALFSSTAGAPELDGSALASRQLPPMLIRGLRFEAGTHTYDVESYVPALFDPCDETVRSGCELSGTLTSIGLDDSEDPVAGAEIRAVDPATGRVISSTATVVDGAFALRVAPFDGEYDLQVVPSLSGSPYRATTFPGAELTLPLHLLIRRYPVVNYEAIVLDEATGSPVSLATVAFQSDTTPDPVSGAPAVYRTSTLSGEGDEAGRIKVVLQPGVFKVVITPVETQDLAIHVEEVIIPDAEGVVDVLGQAFELERRAGLSLHLTSFDGFPVDLVDVQATPRAFDAERSPEAAAFARSSQATSDVDGNLALPIDLGVFDLFARPVSARGFPYAWMPRIEIDGPGGWMTHHLVIPAPTVLTGTVQTTDGAPLGEATVRAFIEAPSQAGPRFLRLGETTSEADGSYRLLLPSSL
jgi:hypothetical protein